MPFPQSTLPVLVDIAPGAEPAADPDVWDDLGLWVDITDDVRVEQKIVIEQGRPDEADQVDPSTCKLTLDNRSGNYSPRNPLGQWYGVLKKNCPLRVRLQRLTDTFTRTVSAGSWGTSDNGITWSGVATGFSVDGSSGLIALASGASASTSVGAAGGSWDFDFVGTVSVNAMPVGASWQNRVNFRRTGAANTFSVLADFTTTGDLNLFLQRTIDSVTVTLADAGPTTFTANQKITIRVKAAGAFIGAKAWPASGTEPAAWNVSSSSEGAYGLDNTSLGTNIQISATRTAGNTATTAAAWDSVSVTAPLFVGNVVEWPVRWDKSGNDSTAPLSASGVLRRLQQGQSPMQSPMYKTIYGQSPQPTAYWPLEDDSGATSAVGIGPGVKPATVYEAGFGFSTGLDPQLAGASSTMTITADTTISGLIPSTALIDGAWLWLFAIYTPAWPSGTTIAVPMKLRGSGTAATWQMQFTNQFGGVLYAVGFDADSNVVCNLTPSVRDFTPGAWHIVQLESWQSGANVANLLRTWNLATGEMAATSAQTFPGSVGKPNNWSVYGDSTTFPQGSVGHLAFFNRRSVFTIDQVLNAGQGYSPETAVQRIARLCAEQGLRLDVADNAAGSALMGRQTADTFLSLIREAEATDLGILSEYQGGLRYRTRDRRYDPNPLLVLDFAQGHIADPPEPTDDDQRVRNDWTVSRKGGSSARVIDEAHVTEHLRYDDSIEINPNTDDVLLDHAAFRVHLGTYDELRWPSVALNLARNSTLIDKFLSLQVGSVATISNPPAQLPVGTVQLVIEGWTQTLSPFGWDAVLNCSSNEPWRLPPLDDAGLVLDSDVSSVNAAATPSALSLAVARPAGTQPWSATAVPFDIDVTGETMTVTAVTGTGTVQTFTVTRAVNGVVKAHNAGEPVTVLTPAYAAL